jgi:hypothetical protein
VPIKAERGQIGSPGYYSKKNKDTPNCLKQGGCHKPIPHKAKRRFPHMALACSLFEQDENPYPARKEP